MAHGWQRGHPAWKANMFHTCDLTQSCEKGSQSSSGAEITIMCVCVHMAEVLPAEYMHDIVHVMQQLLRAFVKLPRTREETEMRYYRLYIKCCQSVSIATWSKGHKPQLLNVSGLEMAPIKKSTSRIFGINFWIVGGSGDVSSMFIYSPCYKCIHLIATGPNYD